MNGKICYHALITIVFRDFDSDYSIHHHQVIHDEMSTTQRHSVVSLDRLETLLLNQNWLEKNSLVHYLILSNCSTLINLCWQSKRPLYEKGLQDDSCLFLKSQQPNFSISQAACARENAEVCDIPSIQKIVEQLRPSALWWLEHSWKIESHPSFAWSLHCLL